MSYAGFVDFLKNSAKLVGKWFSCVLRIRRHVRGRAESLFGWLLPCVCLRVSSRWSRTLLLSSRRTPEHLFDYR